MEIVVLGGAALAFSDRGAGDSILLVHAGAFSDWFVGVATAQALAGFRVIRTRRAGYVEGHAPARHLTIGDHAAHCALLLEQLEVGAAHFCGHSSSALIGLQLAIDRPDLVASLTLLEPAPAGDLAGPVGGAVVPERVGPAVAAYAAGRTADGFDLFMRAVGGDGYRQVLLDALGEEGLARAVSESSYFPDEAGAVLEWSFGLAEAARITAPVLVVEGELTAATAPIPPESVGLLTGLVPQAESAVLPHTTHLMPLEDPEGVARLIAGFARKHRIGNGGVK